MGDLRSRWRCHKPSIAKPTTDPYGVYLPFRDSTLLISDFRRPELYSRLFPCPHLPTSFCPSSSARHDTQRRRLQTRRSRPQTRPLITRTDHPSPAFNHPSDLVWPALSWSLGGRPHSRAPQTIITVFARLTLSQRFNDVSFNDNNATITTTPRSS